MRKILFRGISKADNKYVFGNLIQACDGTFIKDTADNHAWILMTEVYPDSVSQFIGHDRGRRDVFENDILLDDWDNEHTATRYLFPVKLKELRVQRCASRYRSEARGITRKGQTVYGKLELDSRGYPFIRDYMDLVHVVDDYQRFLATDKFGVDVYYGDSVTDDNDFHPAQFEDKAAIIDGVLYKCEKEDENDKETTG